MIPLIAAGVLAGGVAAHQARRLHETIRRRSTTRARARARAALTAAELRAAHHRADRPAVARAWAKLPRRERRTLWRASWRQLNHGR